MITFPTEVHIGRGEAKSVPEIVNDLGDKVLLITSRKQIEQFKPIQEIIDDLNKSNVNVMIFDEVEPDSDSSIVDVAGDIAKSSMCDYVIGIGGDVILNTAKAVALVCANPGDCNDYLTEQEGYRLKIANKPLPSVLIPTVLGSLCEVTPGFTIMDKEDKRQKKLINNLVTPTRTIIDPDMTEIIPKKYMPAASLMMISYAIELYISKASNPVSDTFALRTMDLISTIIPSLLKDPGNIDVRMSLMMASLFVSYGAASGKLGAIYSLSEAITSMNHKIYKGTVASLLLPQFMEFNLTAASNKYVQIAKVLGDNVHKVSVLEAAIKAVERVRVLVEECKIPSKLHELGFEKTDIDEICRVFTYFEETQHLPRTITQDDLRTILDQSY